MAKKPYIPVKHTNHDPKPEDSLNAWHSPGVSGSGFGGSDMVSWPEIKPSKNQDSSSKEERQKSNRG